MRWLADRTRQRTLGAQSPPTPETTSADHPPPSVTLIAPAGRACARATSRCDLLEKCLHLFGVKPATDHKSRKRRDPTVRDVAAEGALYCAALSARRAGPREHRRGADISKRLSPPPLTTVPLEHGLARGQNLSPWETNSNLS